MIKLFLPLVLIVGIIGGVFLVQNRVNIFPRAQEKPFQEKIIISNLAPTSLTISYFTPSPTYDFLQYGENTDVPNVALDARVKEDGLNPQLSTHYFTLRDLKPNTKYYFKINSNNKLAPEGSYLTFQTPSALRGRVESFTFSGNITKEGTEEVPAEAIVFLSAEGGQLLSAPMQEGGSWSLGFAGMRTADMASYFRLPGTDQVKFLAYAGKEGFGQLGTYAVKTSEIKIDVDEAKIPFYRINLGQQPVGVEGQSEEETDRPFWVRLMDFFRDD